VAAGDERRRMFFDSVRLREESDMQRTLWQYWT
jgi:hypothetical protein